MYLIRLLFRPVFSFYNVYGFTPISNKKYEYMIYFNGKRLPVSNTIRIYKYILEIVDPTTSAIIAMIYEYNTGHKNVVTCIFFRNFATFTMVFFFSVKPLVTVHRKMI